MKKLWDSPVPFLAYGVPYAYLGFWGHGETGKVLANFLSIVGVITLMKWTYHRNSLKALFLGNALSLLVSCVCLSVFGTEKWAGPLGRNSFSDAVRGSVARTGRSAGLVARQAADTKAVLRSNQSKCRTFQIKESNHEVRFYSH